MSLLLLCDIPAAPLPPTTTGNPTISSGTGSPQGVVAAPKGSLYLRRDGTTATTLYVKTSGVGKSGWTAK